jgi:hypothetical protein
MKPHAWRCLARYPSNLFIGQVIHKIEQVLVHETILPGDLSHDVFGHFYFS